MVKWFDTTVIPNFNEQIISRLYQLFKRIQACRQLFHDLETKLYKEYIRKIWYEIISGMKIGAKF